MTTNKSELITKDEMNDNLTLVQNETKYLRAAMVQGMKDLTEGKIDIKEAIVLCKLNDSYIASLVVGIRHAQVIGSGKPESLTLGVDNGTE